MDEQNPRLAAERMTGRREEEIAGYDSAALDPRASESLPTGAAPVSRVVTRATTTPGAAEPRTREIRAEIEQTREDMTETVNAIQERLRPGNIAANAAETVRDAARERARDVAESDSVQYVRANPIPTAMIGIGLAGLAWLAWGGNEARQYRRRDYRGGSRDWAGERFDRRFEEERYRTYGAQGSYSTEGAETYAGTQAAGGYTPGLSYSESDAYYRDSSGMGRTGERMGRTGEQMANRARQSASQAQDAARRTWNENPMLIGAASAVLGAVIGMALPETDRENELMGETRDGLVDTVQETVKDKVEQVQQVATDAVNTVQSAAKTAAGLSESSGPQQPAAIDTGRS